MQLLKIGDSGAAVKKWQSFLFGLGYSYVEADADFGPDTERATKDFQIRNDLPGDGKVGNKTYAAAGLEGFPLVEQKSAYPPKPDFPYPSNDQRTKMLGKLPFQVLSGGNIKILNDWDKNNIVMVYIPQLAGVENAPKDCRIAFHKAGITQIKALFVAWEKAGLLGYIKTWAGTFNPRMIRGSATQVSNHAYASAFDINAAWNGLGVSPPLAGEVGTVVPLVEIANANGFFWGGHYQNRKDGMHFELAVLNRFPKAAPPSLEDTIKSVLKADGVKLDQTSSAAAPAANLPPVSQPETSDVQGSGSPADNSGSLNESDPANSASPPIPNQDAPVGDQLETAPRRWLNVEDWKPFVFRMLKRVWASFIGTVTAYTASIAYTAQNADYSDWRVWVAIAAVGVICLFIVAAFATLILLAIWYFNRKEIVQFKTEEIKSLINPKVFNFGLNFEKK